MALALALVLLATCPVQTCAAYSALTHDCLLYTSTSLLPKTGFDVHVAKMAE